MQQQEQDQKQSQEQGQESNSAVRINTEKVNGGWIYAVYLNNKVIGKSKVYKQTYSAVKSLKSLATNLSRRKIVESETSYQMSVASPNGQIVWESIQMGTKDDIEHMATALERHFNAGCRFMHLGRSLFAK